MQTDEQPNIAHELLSDAFAARLDRDGLAPGTIVKYRHAVSDFLGWWERDPVLARRVDVETYLDRTTVLSGASAANGRISGLKAFFNYLDSMGRLVNADGQELRNPVDGIRRRRRQR